jgi:hypothetical protein
MHDAEDRHFDAIEQQKVKKIPYSSLLGNLFKLFNFKGKGKRK